MTTCPHADRIQDALDGELDAAAAGRFHDHLAGCARCSAELELYGRMFAELRATTDRDPGPALTERVLDKVLPSRLRRRWVTALGWSYTGASAACTFALATWVARPETPSWVAARVTDGGMSVMRALWFVLHSLVVSWARLLEAQGLFAELASRVAPLYRAMVLSFTAPWVGAIAWAAILTCVAVLWWMRSRPVPEVRRVDIVGF